MAEFRPKGYKQDPVTVRMTLKKVAMLDKLADEFHMSRSRFINQCIDFAVEHMHPPSDTPHPDADE